MTEKRVCPKCNVRVVKTPAARTCQKCARLTFKNRQDEIVRNAKKRRNGMDAEPSPEVQDLPSAALTRQLQG